MLSSPNYVESQEIGKHGMMPIKNFVVVDLGAKIGHSIMLSLLAKKRQWRISTDNPKMRMRIISNVHRIVIKANGATRIMIVAELLSKKMMIIHLYFQHCKIWMLHRVG